MKATYATVQPCRVSDVKGALHAASSSASCMSALPSCRVPAGNLQVTGSMDEPAGMDSTYPSLLSVTQHTVDSCIAGCRLFMLALQNNLPVWHL